jgi:hypothetical protein
VFAGDPGRYSNYLLNLVRRGRGGDETGSEILGRGQPLPIGDFSADAAPDDSLRARAAACGIAARAAEAHYEAERRNCCRFPVACPARAASGLAQDIPESNTAPSSRADIASSSLTVSMIRRKSNEKRRQVCKTENAP